MAVVMVAAGILAGMVIYTVALMRQCQKKILTGQMQVIVEDVQWDAAASAEQTFLDE